MTNHIPLQGATNFRDLGGYATADGRRVRRGVVYRSDALHRLTDSDHEVLRELEVEVVCDLRYGEERAAEPSRLPAWVSAYHIGLAEAPGSRFVDSLDKLQRDAAAALAYLRGNYLEYPLLYGPSYRALFSRLLGMDRGAVVFHCTAGKDRAGFTAVVLLLTLGVPEETVLDDYLLTNQLWDRGDRVPPDWPSDVVEAIFTAREEYFRAGLSVIEDRFESFDAYLRQHVGLSDEERDALKERCLE